MSRPTVVHLTTVDMSLALLLLPQLVAFRDAGYEVVGVSAPGPWVEVLEDRGIRHVALEGSTRAMSLRGDLAAARSLYRILREIQPQILHTHNPKPGVYGRIVGRLARVPVVVNTVHGLYAQPTDPLMRRLPVLALERIAAAFSHAELLQNHEDRPVLRRLGVPERRLHHLGNGIDLTRFDPARFDNGHRAKVRAEWGVGNDELVVGLVGRLVIEKGYREVFEAARRLPHVRFVVVGPEDPSKADGLTSAELAVAREAGVLFLGMRDDVDELYPGFDIYCLASYREGFPRSAMEAAAMGLPIVATNIRGCRQVVDDGVTGLLVPPGDWDALTAAIEHLVAEHETRSAMGHAAQAKALTSFDDRTQVQITLQIYADLLGSKGIR